MHIWHIRSGNYFIPAQKLTKETHPTGKLSRMHREYPKEYRI